MPSDNPRGSGPPVLFPVPGLSGTVFFPALSGVTVGSIGTVVAVAVTVLVGVAVGVAATSVVGTGGM